MVRTSHEENIFIARLNREWRVGGGPIGDYECASSFIFSQILSAIVVGFSDIQSSGKHPSSHGVSCSAFLNGPC